MSGNESKNVGFLSVALATILITLLITRCVGESNQSSKESQNDHFKTIFRLPTNVIPINYGLQIQPFMRPDQLYFKGSATILVNCNETTNVIQMNANELQINQTLIAVRKLNNDQSSTSLKISGFDYKNEVLTLRFVQNLTAGANYTVFIPFKGDLKTSIVGFYKSSYLDVRTNETRYIALAHFEPTFARKAFPCWDEPSFKATFDIEVIHWSNMTCISNMPNITQKQMPPNWMKTKFDKTVKMSTYLVTYAVGDFRFKENLANIPQFRIVTRPSEIETAKSAIEFGPKILAYFESYFGIKFPLPKIDLLATPDFSSGATEDWGLILFRESLLLYNEAVGSITQFFRVFSVIAHELAHQWFGNLATMAWWKGLWLNEGFATYASYLAVNHLKPEWTPFERFVIDEVQDVMQMDSLKNTHPISVEVNDPSEINQIFDRISYAKAASVIRMLTYMIGEATFKKGLHNYLIAFQYGNADQSDLWRYLQEASDRNKNTKYKVNVQEVMDSWTLQEGYPLITITRDYKTKEVLFRQERFLLNSDDKAKQLNSQYEVPITYTFSAERNWSPDTRLWLHKTNKSDSFAKINLKIANNNWLIANLQEVGFYRVNYDEQNWKLLIDQLKNDPTIINRTNRLQILDDLFNLAGSGVVKYEVALDAVKYLKVEDDALPWTLIEKLTSKINTMLRRSESYGLWQSYMRKLIQPGYEKFALDELDNTDMLNNQMQRAVASVACAYGLESCVESSQRLFYDFMDNEKLNKNTIPKNIRSIVYCTAIHHGDEQEWNFVYKLYLNEQNANERDAMLSALTCSRVPWIITRYLNLTFDQRSAIRAQDSESVFKQLAAQNYAKDIAFNFMRENWEKMYARLSRKQFDSIFKWFDTINSPFELNLMKQFYKQVSSKVGSPRPFLMTVETIEANISWMKKFKGQIDQFLKNQQS